jgi:signal transduction histidine kinase
MLLLMSMKSTNLPLLRNLRSKVVVEKSLEQHASMCVDNSEDLYEAKQLAKELHEDIESRMKRYANCLSHCSKNYREWLIEDYKLKLILLIGKKFREKLF